MKLLSFYISQHEQNITGFSESIRALEDAQASEPRNIAERLALQQFYSNLEVYLAKILTKIATKHSITFPSDIALEIIKIQERVERLQIQVEHFQTEKEFKNEFAEGAALIEGKELTKAIERRDVVTQHKKGARKIGVSQHLEFKHIQQQEAMEMAEISFRDRLTISEKNELEKLANLETDELKKLKATSHPPIANDSSPETHKPTPKPANRISSQPSTSEKKERAKIGAYSLASLRALSERR